MTNFKKFSDARAAMPAPTKDTDAYKYKYADLEQVKGIVDNALRKEGLEAIQYQENGVLNTRIVDVESGESVVTDTRPLLLTGTDQQRGSSETYQRRYALLTVCGLAPTDDDGAAASASPTEHQGGRDALRDAQQRLWTAVKAYAEKSGGDAEKLAAGCKDRQDYQETPEWYNLVAQEFETA